MKLTLDTLKQAGAFTGAPVEKEITWVMGGKEHKATTFVRPLAYNAMVSELLGTRDGGDIVAGRIAASICDAEGKPVFTAGDITGESDPDRGPLDGGLTVALLAVIAEVNNLGKITA